MLFFMTYQRIVNQTANLHLFVSRTAEMSQQSSATVQVNRANGARKVLLFVGWRMERLMHQQRLARREPLDADGAHEGVSLGVRTHDLPVNPGHVEKEVFHADEVRIADVTNVTAVEVEKLVLKKSLEPAQFTLTNLD